MLFRGGDDMNKKVILEKFVANRPEAIGAYGYGSGVFSQEGYKDTDNPQIDIIFLVEDLIDWHKENMRINGTDYSIMGKHFLRTSDIEDIKGKNRITYFSHINENGFRFKYGVMEEKDFLLFLNSWQNFFVPGRFQKPVLKIIGSEEEDNAIEYNKRQAMLVTALISPTITNRFEFFRLLCSLSYNGTLRMVIAENPNKVFNIVEGNYDRLNEIYSLPEDYIETDGDLLLIKHTKALKHVKELPIGLLTYLYKNGYDFSNVFSVRHGIFDFLKEHNKAEEISQTIEGIKTNGIVRSAPYLAAKVKKRVVGK